MPNPSEMARVAEEEYLETLDKAFDIRYSKGTREAYLRICRVYERENGIEGRSVNK